MSLRLIYGRAGSGKSNFCFENIKYRLENNCTNNLILLVPEQFSFQSEKNLIKRIGATGIINAEVLSFKRLAYRIFNEVGGITRNHMNTSGKCMLLYKIVNDLKNKLTVFAASSNQEGFINNISDMITEFKNYNVTPDMLSSASDTVEDTLLKNKIKDLRLIYETFENIMHEGYIDQDDDLTILYTKIEESQYLRNCEIWIDEFNSFTPQQYNILEKLFKLAKRINITLCSDNEKNSGISEDVFLLTQKTENKILKIAQDNNIKIEKPIILSKKPYPRFKDSSELAYLENNFFVYSKHDEQKIQKDISHINIFKAGNSYDEVEFAARDIVRLCRDKNYRYKDIAVVTRNLDIYENIIKAVFTEHTIPYFIDKKKDIDDNPLIILMRSSIEIFTKNWSYESVFRYLKCGLIDIPREDVDLLENYVLSNGIRGKKKWTKEKNWNYAYGSSLSKDSNEEEDNQINKINEIRNNVTAPLNNFYLHIHECKKVKDYCEAIYKFLCSINMPLKIQKFINDFKQHGNQSYAMEYSQIWNLIMELLDQAVEVMGDTKVNLDEFIKILSIGFNQHTMGLIPSSLDQVTVSSVDRIKSHEIKVLYLIGVNDGVFPKADNNEGIFNDIDKMNLNNIGIELSSDTKAKAFEEQFLVYTILSLASKYLCVSYPIADFQGKALRPSIIISRLKDIFPNITEKEDIIVNCEDENMEWISKPIPTLNKLISMMRKNIEGEKISPLWKDVYAWFKNNEVYKDNIENIFKGFTHSNTVNNISTDKIKRLYGDRPFYSVSRLEKYIQCPFAYYVQYGLKAKERKVFKYNPPDMGTFMHKIIDDFCETVRKNDFHYEELTKEWCDNTISKLVEDNILEGVGVVLNSSPRYRYYKDRLKRVLKRAIWVIVKQIQDSGFEPLGYEMKFGYDGDFPPIEITLNNGRKVKLIGRIDRVDKLINDDGIFYRIIDYKSGYKDFKLSDVYYGFQIQLLTYLDAIIENENKINNKNNMPAGVFYFKIDDPIIKSNEDLNEAEIEKEIMKKLKMDGLVLKDTKIVREMDKNIEGISLIIPASLKNDGSLSSRSKAATKEQFQMLRDHVKNNLVKSCEEMLEGNISIKPYKIGDKTSCGFCIFSSICQFDTSLDNSFRYINDKKDDEIWKLLENENSSKEEGDK